MLSIRFKGMYIYERIWISIIYAVAGQLENIKLRIYRVIRIYEL